MISKKMYAPSNAQRVEHRNAWVAERARAKHGVVIERKTEAGGVADRHVGLEAEDARCTGPTSRPST